MCLMAGLNQPRVFWPGAWRLSVRDGVGRWSREAMTRVWPCEIAPLSLMSGCEVPDFGTMRPSVAMCDGAGKQSERL